MDKHQLHQLAKGLITQGQLCVIKGTQLSDQVQNTLCAAFIAGSHQVAARFEVEASTHGQQLQDQGTCPGQWQQGESIGLSLTGFTGF